MQIIILKNTCLFKYREESNNLYASKYKKLHADAKFKKDIYVWNSYNRKLIIVLSIEKAKRRPDKRNEWLSGV